MSHLHIEQLLRIDAEYQAVRAAVSARLADPALTGSGDLSRAQSNLETTYIVRLFIEFEGLLRGTLLTHNPRRRVSREAYNNINRAARLFSIPDPIRDDVHTAREFRNSVVHPGGLTAAALTFRQARGILNKFLRPLP